MMSAPRKVLVAKKPEDRKADEAKAGAKGTLTKPAGTAAKTTTTANKEVKSAKLSSSWAGSLRSTHSFSCRALKHFHSVLSVM